MSTGMARIIARSRKTRERRDEDKEEVEVRGTQSERKRSRTTVGEDESGLRDERTSSSKRRRGEGGK